ncbi:MAG: ribonuclease D [Proteobacteria bacterium]|nr:ribonuclease D [Pseudomonadota bacterium]
MHRLPASCRTRDLIETEQALAEVVTELQSATRVGLDTEGDGFFRYRARLCTVQLSTADSAYVIDTLRVEPAPLCELLADTGPTKIVHDAGFDAKLLAERGVPLGRVFDTSVAARFLGEAQTGLSALVRKHLGVELPKEHQRADWGKRPLAPESLAYLLNDVRYLIPLAEQLLDRCRRKDIETEVDEECLYVLHQATHRAEPTKPAWRRIRGAVELDRTQQARLQQLVRVRERFARDRDVPAFRILVNSVLLRLARSAPQDVQAVRRTLGSAQTPGLAYAVVESLKGVRADACSVDSEDQATPMPSPAERARRRRCAKTLSAWRDRIARERRVDAQAVLPGHCLRDLCTLRPPSLDELSQIQGLGRVRAERYGTTLLALLASSCTGE